MGKNKSLKRKQSEIIWGLMKEENWEGARLLLNKLLEEEPDSHWLLSRLSLTYHEERNYEKALEYVVQALDLAPHCPMVSWDYAGTLDMLEYKMDAMKVYQRLIHRGVNRIAYDECGEGIRKARSLINDCRYRLACIYADMDEFSKARKYIQEHISHRNRNCTSIYSLRDVKKRQELINEGRNPRSGQGKISGILLAEKIAALKAKRLPYEDIYETVNRLSSENKYDEARQRLMDWLKKNPQDHRALYRLARTYIPEENYEKIAEYLEQSLEIEPRCPTALSDYSYVLYMLNRNTEAFQVCKSLLQRGVKRLANYRECKPGLRKAKGFVNDCRFILGMLYGSSGEYGSAKRYIKSHLANRGYQTPSIFKLNSVKSALAAVLRGQDPT
jgi:tetratricopeptide (TPR) repeat protein